EKIPALAVVGIAGPGDALANEETYETLQLVRENHPELALCLATNGLLLPTHVEELVSMGVDYVTVTISALDPVIGGRIYSWVRHEGKRLRGRKAFDVLSKNQWDGVGSCVESGMVVKVNSVLIPGINEFELPKIAEKSRDMGVDVMNVIPFLPVRGSEFESRRAPTGMEVKRVRADCEVSLRQINHCARCRADAIGYLGCDESIDFYGSLQVE
ncbi:MAG: radical SAM protein, partial [Thermoplasmata archaeon]